MLPNELFTVKHFLLEYHDLANVPNRFYRNRFTTERHVQLNSIKLNH